MSSPEVWPLKAPGRLWHHVVALGLVLVALSALLNNDSMVSADEGAVLAQVEVLSTTGSWSMANPVPEIDPSGRWFAIDLSDRSDDGYLPYAKHAAYPWIATHVFDVGGLWAVLLLSAVGTLAAAVLAALIARRISPRLDIATLWVVGLFSPLFFDSFWVIAHSIGAAFATLAVWSLLAVAMDQRRLTLIPLAVGVGGAVMFRSEGLLFGVALAGAGFLLATRPSLADRRLVAGASALAGAMAIVGWRLDGWMFARLAGRGASAFVIRDDTTWIDGRLHGAWATLLRPQLQDPTTAGAIFLTIGVLGVVVALYVRFKPGESTIIRAVSLLAAVGAFVVLFLPKAPVPGLLLAFPLIPIGAIQIRRSSLRSVPQIVIVSTAVLFVGAVLATQYRAGGSMEWGGRFLHLIIPSLVPVALMAIAGAGSAIDVRTRRIAAASMAAVMSVLVVFTIGSILRIHGATADLVDAITTTAQTTRSAKDSRGALVVSTTPALGRFAWQHSVHARYLRVEEPKDLPTIAARFRATGVEDFVYTTARYGPSTDEFARDMARLKGFDVDPGRTVEVGPWTIMVLERVG